LELICSSEFSKSGNCTHKCSFSFLKNSQVQINSRLNEKNRISMKRFAWSKYLKTFLEAIIFHRLCSKYMTQQMVGISQLVLQAHMFLTSSIFIFSHKKKRFSKFPQKVFVIILRNVILRKFPIVIQPIIVQNYDR